MTVKIIKEDAERWLVWNQTNNQMVTIVAIQDVGFLAKQHKQYRIDMNGQTAVSMIDHFQTARSIAIKIVKCVDHSNLSNLLS